MTFSADDAMDLEAGNTTPEETAVLLQKAINSLTAWKMQGSYGRSMMDAIDSGVCMLGLEDTRDAVGNHLPSRFQVKEGTRGSRQFVVDHKGEDWVAMLEELDKPAAKKSARP